MVSLTLSLPIPLRLTPPNGRLSHLNRVVSLIITVPTLSFEAILYARAKSFVKIDASKPYGVEFATSIACSSDSFSMIGNIGPKTSWEVISTGLVTLTTVGGK